MPEVTELVTKFSFIGSSAPLDKYNFSLAGSIRFLAKFTAATAVAIGAVSAFTITTLKNADAISQLSKETGISVSRLQTLEGISKQLGIPFESLATSIGNLSTKIGEAAQKGSEDFSRLGISVRDSSGNVKSAEQILNELRGSFDRLNLSFAERKSFVEALGLDAQSLKLLSLSGSEFARLSAEANKFGKITEGQQQQIRDFNAGLGGLSFGISQISKQIALQFAPDLTNLIKKFSDLLAGSKDFIINGVQTLVRGIKILSDSFQRLFPFIVTGIGLFAAWKLATIGLSGVMGILSGILAFIASPVVLIVAGIAALLLVVDDLIVAFQGGKSVIRDFFLEFFNFDIKPILENIVNFVKRIKELFTDLIPQKVIDFFDKNVDFQGGKNSAFVPMRDRIPRTGTQTSNQINIEIKTDNPIAAGKAVKNELQKQLEFSQTQSSKGGL